MPIKHITENDAEYRFAAQIIRDTFFDNYRAHVDDLAKNIILFSEHNNLAVAGWMDAGETRLYLERHLNAPVEIAVSNILGRQIKRKQIVEIRNVASTRRGLFRRHVSSTFKFFLDQGFNVAAFTATEKLLGTTTKIGIPMRKLGDATPCDQMHRQTWGTYYDTKPAVMFCEIDKTIQHLAKSRNSP